MMFINTKADILIQKIKDNISTEDKWFEASSILCEKIDWNAYTDEDILAFIELVLNEIDNAQNSKNDIEMIFYSSLLISEWKRVDILIRLLDYLVSDAKLNYKQLHFVYCQLGGIIFNFLDFDVNSISIRMQKLLNKIMNIVQALIPNSLLESIPYSERKKDFVVVISEQFIDIQHGPTKSALDRCAIIKNKMNKKVLLINAAEVCQISGYVPFYDVSIGTYKSELSNQTSVDWKGTSISFFQSDQIMPDVELIKEIIVFLRKEKPLFGIEIGASGILAGIVSRIIPVMTNVMVPSKLSCFSTTAETYAKELSKDNVEWLLENNINQSRIIKDEFTWELQESTHHHKRSDFSIREEDFCIAIVGGRLDNELTDSFLDILEEIVEPSYKYILMGRCDDFDNKINKHPKLKDKMINWGFVYDTQSYLAMCDVYLNPPRKGGGFSAVEAMKQGIVPIALDFGDVAVAVGNEYCINSFDELKFILEKYRLDKEHYKHMSDNARKRAEIVSATAVNFINTINTFIERFVENTDEV